MVPDVPYYIDANIRTGLIRSYYRGKQHCILMVVEGAGKGSIIAEQIAAQTSFSSHVTVLGYMIF